MSTSCGLHYSSSTGQKILVLVSHQLNIPGIVNPLFQTKPR